MTENVQAAFDKAIHNNQSAWEMSDEQYTAIASKIASAMRSIEQIDPLFKLQHGSMVMSPAEVILHVEGKSQLGLRFVDNYKSEQLMNEKKAAATPYSPS